MTDKMTAKIVRREDEPPKTNRPFPNITPEQAEWLKRQPIPQASARCSTSKSRGERSRR